MGTNRRYAAHYDRLMDDRILAGLCEKGGLQTLSPKELSLDQDPLTVDPEPKPVKAWVRFYDHPTMVEAWACRWTPRAIGIKFFARGKAYTTWVWANAVEEDPTPRTLPEQMRRVSDGSARPNQGRASPP